jgi:hypothetical protein
MKTSPILALAATSMVADIPSNGLLLHQAFIYSYYAIWTGSPVGTIKVQVSNDNVVALPGSTNPSSNVVNWLDYPSTTQTVSGAGSFVWNFSDAGYLWSRVYYTFTSGTGSLLINACVKGNI